MTFLRQIFLSLVQCRTFFPIYHSYTGGLFSLKTLSCIILDHFTLIGLFTEKQIITKRGIGYFTHTHCKSLEAVFFCCCCQIACYSTFSNIAKLFWYQNAARLLKICQVFRLPGCFVAEHCVNFSWTDKKGRGKSYPLDLPVSAILERSCLQYKTEEVVMKFTQYPGSPHACNPVDSAHK